MTALPRQGSAMNCQTFDVLGTTTSTGDLPRPAQPIRKRTPQYQDWSEYRRARAEASGSPGPGTDRQQQGAWRFCAELMDSDIRDVYAAEIRRGRR